MAKHQEMVHHGEPPNFTMRVVRFHKSALSRQTGEAVSDQEEGREQFLTPGGSLLEDHTETPIGEGGNDQGDGVSR